MEQKPSLELKELHAICKEADELYHELALHLGLSDSVFYILYAIAEFGNGCLQKDIAQQYFLNPKTINSAIKKLEIQGYIVLKKGKRRDMHIHLTTKGQELVTDKILPVIQMENSIFDEFLPEERQQMFRLMRKYITICRQKIKECW